MRYRKMKQCNKKKKKNERLKEATIIGFICEKINFCEQFYNPCDETN